MSENTRGEHHSKYSRRVYVLDVIFYTEDEEGGITYYEAPDADWSTLAESVELEDLLEIEDPRKVTDED